MNRTTQRLWQSLRYGLLLPSCRRRPSVGALYARAVGAFEYFADPARRQVAVRRIERSLGCSAARAARIFRACLISEAREEADSAFALHDPSRLESLFACDAEERPEPSGPVLYVTCHLGSPILGFLYLRRHYALPVRMIVRKLDENNPVPPAKRRFGTAKMAKGEAIAGTPFLGTDSQSLFAARADLLEGKAVLAAIDVPGDVVSRRRTLRVFDLDLVVASGIVSLAAMTGAAVQPVFAVRDPSGLRLVFGTRIPAGEEDVLAPQLAREITKVVGRFPDQWWLWPYVVEAPSAC